MTIEELKNSIDKNQRDTLNKLLIDIRDELNNEIIQCNKYLRKRNDFGQTHRLDDPYEIISFTRGKSIGFIQSRDEINNLIDKFKIDEL